jgi:hypothetical protein
VDRADISACGVFETVVGRIIQETNFRRSRVRLRSLRFLIVPFKECDPLNEPLERRGKDSDPLCGPLERRHSSSAELNSIHPGSDDGGMAEAPASTKMTSGSVVSASEAWA